MNFTDRPIASVNLVGGRTCLDFVNTVGKREANRIQDEKLADYYDLLAWSIHAGLFTKTEATKMANEAERFPERAKNVFERAFVLREAIHRICASFVNQKSASNTDLEVLNQELALAFDRRKLVGTKNKNLIWEWNKKESMDQILCLVADSAADLLTNGDLTRLGECDRCGWLFEDTSKNRSRQWCDMKDCGNLMKVQRFRSRSRKKS